MDELNKALKEAEVVLNNGSYNLSHLVNAQNTIENTLLPFKDMNIPSKVLTSAMAGYDPLIQISKNIKLAVENSEAFKATNSLALLQPEIITAFKNLSASMEQIARTASPALMMEMPNTERIKKSFHLISESFPSPDTIALTKILSSQEFLQNLEPKIKQLNPETFNAIKDDYNKRAESLNKGAQIINWELVPQSTKKQETRDNDSEIDSKELLANHKNSKAETELLKFQLFSPQVYNFVIFIFAFMDGVTTTVDFVTFINDFWNWIINNFVP